MTLKLLTIIIVITPMMGECPVLDRKTVLNRLYPEKTNPCKTEEALHPWRTEHSQAPQEPLLRIWDQHSGSQPDKDGRMMSRAPDMRLDTAESRRGSLAKHLKHRDWTQGPYILFTTSSTAIEDLVRMRVKS